MTQRVSIVGATGYSGAELAALLARHPRAEVVGAYGSGASAPTPFGALHPSLAGRSGPEVEPFSVERAVRSGAAVAFLATPNETSAEAAPRLLDAGLAVVDLSGAFRLRNPEDYPKWYGFAHPRPDLLASAVYGLPEWADGGLSGARLVANPGCYATAILLALKPILSLLDPRAAIVCDAKSGVSGAGKRSEVAYSFTELEGNFKAYGVGDHRHEPEMRQGLDLGPDAPFVFVPHLLPVARGILATIHVTLARAAEPFELSAAFAAAYARAPFVRVRPPGQLPELRHVVGTPRAEIGFVLLRGGWQAVVVSVIDNLLKGAASQAVQNFNRMHGFAETEGLS